MPQSTSQSSPNSTSQSRNSMRTRHFTYYFLNILLAILAFAIVLILAIPIGFYGMAMYLSPSLPSLSEIKTAPVEMPLQIYSQDDKLIGQFGNRMSLPVTNDQVPKDLINAFLAAEDSTFYEHSGISVKGLGRAITEVITHQEGQTGGSTITMQMAKNYFLTPERTFSRKLTELFLARRIEDELTKDEILTLYLNKIYMGEGAYGIKAAAKKYYSKSLEDLTISEMATLAGLPKAPSDNNPISNPKEALERRNWILGRMQALNFITKAEYNEAVNSPLDVHYYREKLDINMPYLAEMTRKALVDQYGDIAINSGWRVKITVNSEAQAAAEAAMNKGLVNYDRRHGWRGAEANDEPLTNFRPYANMQPAQVTKVDYRSFEAKMQNGDVVSVPWSGMSWARKYRDANRTSGYPNRAADIVNKGDIVRLVANADGKGWKLTQVPNVQGSMVSLDPETGALVSLVGGFDYRHSKFNRAIQGWRQPGSTIKPLIYSAALEKGYRPDSLISDSPIRVGNWRPKNSDGRYYGPITLRRGLYLSRNLVSIRLLQSVGTADARHLLDKFGLDKDKLPTTLSLALGAGAATPLQMATAYATFANGGHRIQPYYIDQIHSYDGRLLYLANPQNACAPCVNKNLEEINEKVQDDFIEQMNARRERYEQALEALKAHPDLLEILDAATTNEMSTVLEDDEGNIATSDTEVNADSSDSETSSTDKDESKLANQALVDKYKPLRDDIFAIKYSGAPKSDRMKPSLVQYNPVTQAPRILTAGVAYEMAGILRDVIQRGTGRRALSLGRSDIGGKTGTTNNMKDAWFAGFHPTLATVVWVGFDQPDTLGRGEYGGVAALPIWVNFMGSQLKDKPTQWVTIDNKSKSEREQQDVISLSDELKSSKKAKSKTKSNSKSSNTAPPKPKVAERNAQPEPSADTKLDDSDRSKDKSTKSSESPSKPKTKSSTEQRSPSQQANPLTTKKVDELPAL